MYVLEKKDRHPSPTCIYYKNEQYTALNVQQNSSFFFKKHVFLKIYYMLLLRKIESQNVNKEKGGKTTFVYLRSFYH